MQSSLHRTNEDEPNTSSKQQSLLFNYRCRNVREWNTGNLVCGKGPYCLLHVIIVGNLFISTGVGVCLPVFSGFTYFLSLPEAAGKGDRK